MVIQYGSSVLVPGSLQGVTGTRLNGKQLVDEATLFRALQTSYFSRGNKGTTFEFDAWWYFNSRGLAESFIMSHWGTLSYSDLLTVTCGENEASQIVYQIPAAVLESVSLADWNGTAVKMHYVFKGGLFASQSLTPTNEDALIKRGTVTLGLGATQSVIAFTSNFAGVPTVIAKINRGTTNSDTVPDWDVPTDLITAGGFTAKGQATPLAGYVLNWVAIAP